MKVQEVIDRLSQFAKQNLGRDPKVINVRNTAEGWRGIVQVYEENSFIKSLGLETNQQERKRYEIRMDENLEIVSFGEEEEED